MTHRTPGRVRKGVPTGGQFAATPHAEAGVRLLFHVAPDEARDSIAAHGLDHTLGESAYAHLDYPQGNYLFADPEAATEYAAVRAEEEREEYGVFEARDYDVYEVRLPADHDLTQDPFHDDESGLGATAVFTTRPVTPDALRILG